MADDIANGFKFSPPPFQLNRRRFSNIPDMDPGALSLAGPIELQARDSSPQSHITQSIPRYTSLIISQATMYPATREDAPSILYNPLTNSICYQEGNVVVRRAIIAIKLRQKLPAPATWVTAPPSTAVIKRVLWAQASPSMFTSLDGTTTSDDPRKQNFSNRVMIKLDSQGHMNLAAQSQSLNNQASLFPIRHPLRSTATATNNTTSINLDCEYSQAHRSSIFVGSRTAHSSGNLSTARNRVSKSNRSKSRHILHPANTFSRSTSS
ncbi:hypothetical protein VTL71DRAFT_9436 [Oculimacula yallundae]|uniref:Uncharacterized protein n=1 Tax=Oculimacula yallundae TaxID=86028 RepID=A0ABR4BTH6_9HELO